MAYSWITPKTDWTTSTHFTYTDYNRIRNNLLFLNDKINELFPDKAKTLDLGDALTGYTDNYYPSQFNAFEDALESFTRAGQNVNIGTKGVYKGNEPFIMADALNRIEKCCLNWYNINPTIESAKISPTSFEFEANDTQQLTLTIVPSNAQYTVEWSSSNNTVATVDSNGLVTCLGEGDVTIYATIKQNGKKDIVLKSNGIYVGDISVKTIKLSKTTLSINEGFSDTITVTILPSNATNKYNYTVVSSDSSVVKVTSSKDTITVKGLSVGTATITVSVDGLSASATVTVNEYVKATAVNLSINPNHVGGWYKGTTDYFVVEVLPSNHTGDWSWTLDGIRVSVTNTYRDGNKVWFTISNVQKSDLPCILTLRVEIDGIKKNIGVVATYS